jgi:hypothetical protein
MSRFFYGHDSGTGMKRSIQMALLLFSRPPAADNPDARYPLARLAINEEMDNSYFYLSATVDHQLSGGLC